MVRASFGGVACPSRPTHESLELIRSGDHVAAEVLLDGWENVVQASALSKTRCLASRDDIAQAGRLAVLRAVRLFYGRRGDFNHYVSRAISNGTRRETVKLASARRFERPLELALDRPTRGNHEASHCVRDWLCTLPRLMQRVFVLLYRRVMTQRQASARLGISQPRISQINRELVERGRRELAGLGAALMN